MPQLHAFRAICASLLSLGLLTSISFEAAAADAYPSKVIRIIVPTPPGGNLDLVFRTLADRLASSLGQPVTVENRTGGSSAIGTRFVAQSPADGYTLLAIGNTFLSAPAVIANIGYDPISEFTGITMVVRVPNVVLVPANSPSKTLADLIARAKARPGAVSYASAGSGSVAHFAAERMSRDAGVKMLHVPYKGGGAAMIDVAGGRIDMMFEPAGAATSYIRTGKVRALAVSTKSRLPALPEIPTIDEAGVKGFEDMTINALLAPAGTPREIIARLHAEVVKALDKPDLRERFSAQSIEPAPSASPEEFQAFVRSEVARYVKLTRDANIKAN